ncbi:hypothetical protein ACOMHN_012435 [Nucella lapillus]
MQKSFKMGPGHDRRFSQPVMSSSSSSTNPSSMTSHRRGSDQAAGARGLDLLAPPAPHYDDKLTVVEAKGPRKIRGKDGADGPSFDSDQYNPDGSLRTVHRMPDINESFKQARKARYIRHRAPPDFDKELPVEQIFR